MKSFHSSETHKVLTSRQVDTRITREELKNPNKLKLLARKQGRLVQLCVAEDDEWREQILPVFTQHVLGTLEQDRDEAWEEIREILRDFLISGKNIDLIEHRVRSALGDQSARMQAKEHDRLVTAKRAADIKPRFDHLRESVCLGRLIKAYYDRANVTIRLRDLRSSISPRTYIDHSTVSSLAQIRERSTSPTRAQKHIMNWLSLSRVRS